MAVEAFEAAEAVMAVGVVKSVGALTLCVMEDEDFMVTSWVPRPLLIRSNDWAAVEGVAAVGAVAGGGGGKAPAPPPATPSRDAPGTGAAWPDWKDRPPARMLR